MTVNMKRSRWHRGKNLAQTLLATPEETGHLRGTLHSQRLPLHYREPTRTASWLSAVNRQMLPSIFFQICCLKSACLGSPNLRKSLQLFLRVNGRKFQIVFRLWRKFFRVNACPPKHRLEALAFVCDRPFAMASNPQGLIKRQDLISFHLITYFDLDGSQKRFGHQSGLVHRLKCIALFCVSYVVLKLFQQ